MPDLALDVFFSNVTMFYHDNNLLIPDWRVIYDYLCSLPGIEKVMRKNKEASVKFLKDRVTDISIKTSEILDMIFSYPVAKWL